MINMFDRLEDSAMESDGPVWMQIGTHLLIIGWIGDAMTWILDGELLTRDEARQIVEVCTRS